MVDYGLGVHLISERWGRCLISLIYVIHLFVHASNHPLEDFSFTFAGSPGGTYIHACMHACMYQNYHFHSSSFLSGEFTYAYIIANQKDIHQYSGIDWYMSDISILD